MLRSRYLIKTLEKIVRKRTLKSETNEQLKSWNKNDLRLIEKRILKHQISKKS